MALTVRDTPLVVKQQGSSVLTDSAGLLTSLPYLDSVPPAVQKRVNSLIEVHYPWTAVKPREPGEARPFRFAQPAPAPH